MKASLNEFLIMVFVMLVVACSEENADPVVLPEPTVQELILGTWNINHANSDIYAWTFVEGEASVTFRSDSVVVFQNNGNQTFIPQGNSQKTYVIEKRCLHPDNNICSEEEWTDVLVIYNGIGLEASYNTITFRDNGNELIFGTNYMDSIDYYCTKMNDNL